MSWIGYIWIAMLIIAWLIWTIKCVIDLIDDIKSSWDLLFCIETESSWVIWVIVHLIVLFVFSLTYFLLMR